MTVSDRRNGAEGIGVDGWKVHSIRVRVIDAQFVRQDALPATNHPLD